MTKHLHRPNPSPLDGWTKLNAAIMQMSESEIQDLMDMESVGRNRPDFMRRMYGRFKKLREQRELEEMRNGRP